MQHSAEQLRCWKKITEAFQTRLGRVGRRGWKKCSNLPLNPLLPSPLSNPLSHFPSIFFVFVKLPSILYTPQCRLCPQVGNHFIWFIKAKIEPNENNSTILARIKTGPRSECTSYQDNCKQLTIKTGITPLITIIKWIIKMKTKKLRIKSKI